MAMSVGLCYFAKTSVVTSTGLTKRASKDGYCKVNFNEKET